MRRIKVILAMVAAVTTTMVVSAPAMAQTVFGSTGVDVPAVPFAPPLEDAFMPDPHKILAAMRSLAAY